MQAHTRKRHIENKASVNKMSVPKETHKDGTSWRESFVDLFEECSEGGIVLQGFRYREGLTQVQLAKIIGITQPNLSSMECGKRSIGKEIAKKFAAFFKTDYRVFL
jgi:DNA-binding XRE family transcriptional regulator